MFLEEKSRLRHAKLDFSPAKSQRVMRFSRSENKADHVWHGPQLHFEFDAWATGAQRRCAPTTEWESGRGKPRPCREISLHGPRDVRNGDLRRRCRRLGLDGGSGADTLCRHNAGTLQNGIKLVGGQ